MANDILDYLPEGTPGYMAPAWLSALLFALETRSIMEAYTADTGDVFPTQKRTPLDTMIDEATGRDWHFLTEFVQWFNVHHWGDINEEEPDGN